MFESPELVLESSLLELESSLEVVEELPELLVEELVEDDDEVLEVLEALVFEEPALLVAWGVELPPPPPPPPHAVMTTEQEANRINAILELVIFYSPEKKEPTFWSVLFVSLPRIIIR